MISKHTGGEIVESGIYWSASNREFISVPQQGGRLEGGVADRYVKSPAPLVLVIGPLMGLAYALFLPISGLLVLIPFLLEKARGAVSSRGLAAAHAAGAHAQPGVSYLEPYLLSHPRAARPETEERETGQPCKLVNLAGEVAEKRWRAR